jgi:alkanesulfonate monooxygenase SsuD/methylene tetrahydromethanopterin reductase-like flavin-dependent oxidoreductase (luciferase family)
MNGMKLGVVLPTMSPRDGAPGDVAAAARHAEELGFESVWVVDQLIAGTGVPLLDSLTSLAAAAAVTERVGLGAGVLILPLRPVVWMAKQVASLQYLSGDRVLLGVGAGGDRHSASWAAAGIPQRSRGRRTDEALRWLPGLISGQPVRLDPDGEEVVLSPGVKVPPVIVGGMSEAAATRAATFGDGWFILAAPPDIPRYQALAAERAATRGRPAPAITTNAIVALDGDPHLPGRDVLMRLITEPDGMFGIPADQATGALVTGGPAAVAGHLAAIAAHGAHRTVVTLAAGDWFRQAELLAEARSQLSA